MTLNMALQHDALARAVSPRPLLILLHQRGVANHVREHDGTEAADGTARFVRTSLHPRNREPGGRRVKCGALLLPPGQCVVGP